MEHDAYLRGMRILDLCKEVDLALIMNTSSVDPNFLYVTGFSSGLFEYSFLIVKRRRISLATSVLEYGTAKKQANGGMDIVRIDRREDLRRFLKKEIEGKEIGINGSFLPYSIYMSIKKYRPKKVADISAQFIKARMVKDAGEINLLRKAVSITKRAMARIKTEFRDGITEKELAAKFDSISAELGSDGPSFRTIVCFGRNAAYPHHSPDETKLKDGDFILIDAGAKFKNYSSDITRTFIFGGKGKNRKEMADVYETVKEAQALAIAGIKPGIKGKEIHKIAQEHIDKAHGGKYKGTFIHALGHSVGIEVHDGPGFSPGEEGILKPGMVITAEPGIYIEGFGGVRIEDDILVTKNGAEIL
jgi:Xaa-Pro dipeptidase